MNHKERIILSLWKHFYPMFTKKEASDIFNFVNKKIFANNGEIEDVGAECIAIVDFSIDEKITINKSTDIQESLDIELDEIEF